MTTQTYEAVVHKASLPLGDNESIREFTRKLSDAGSKALMTKQNLTTKGTDIFMIEAFSKAAVFEVFKFGPDVPQDKRMRFFVMKFTRKDTGDFEFSDSTEVQRVTRFEPKQSVTKSIGAAPDGWEETSKSFWNGAL